MRKSCIFNRRVTCRQLAERSRGLFDWVYLASGPDLWRIQISKLAIKPAADSCCAGGACCG
jgi:uncharacterized protein (DUF2249 family)